MKMKKKMVTKPDKKERESETYLKYTKPSISAGVRLSAATDLYLVENTNARGEKGIKKRLHSVDSLRKKVFFSFFF